MKKLLFFMLFFIFLAQFQINAIDGFFIGYKGGFLLKVDVASAFVPKERDMNIPTGIGEYGATTPHGFPRVLEAIASRRWSPALRGLSSCRTISPVHFYVAKMG